MMIKEGKRLYIYTMPNWDHNMKLTFCIYLGYIYLVLRLVC